MWASPPQSPPRSPPIAISRVWCLFELLHTLSLPSPKLQLAVTPNTEKQLAAWCKEATALSDVIGIIRSVDAKATLGRDWVHIMTMIALRDKTLPRELVEEAWPAQREASTPTIVLDINNQQGWPNVPVGFNDLFFTVSVRFQDYDEKEVCGETEEKLKRQGSVSEGYEGFRKCIALLVAAAGESGTPSREVEQTPEPISEPTTEPTPEPTPEPTTGRMNGASFAVDVSLAMELALAEDDVVVEFGVELRAVWV